MYKNPQLYDDIMWWKKDDIQFWLSTINKTKSYKILELCCGTGRIGLPLIKKGLDYYGIDLSKKFITHFKSKAEDLNCNLNNIMTGDVRNFNLNQTFDFIFIGFNSLAHLLSNQDIENCFQVIQKHMHSKTVFAIDIFVPDASFLYRDDNQKIDIMDFLDSQTNEQITIMESIKYDASTEVNHIDWEFINKEKICRFNYKFDMRMLFPDTLNRILTECNYHISNFYGDYDCNKFNEDSEKQIYLCTKLS